MDSTEVSSPLHGSGARTAHLNKVGLLPICGNFPYT
jgi:hypothetical protein